MREKKYRIWTGSIMMQPKDIMTLHQETVTGLTVGQWESQIYIEFTGLKDKNGKEIFEGDIVECTLSFEGSTLPHMGTVVYSNRLCSFGTENKGGLTLFCKHNSNTREVIGNIYENPELLN